MKKETMITLGIALAALVFVKFSGSMDIRQSKMSTVPVNQFEAPKAGDKIAVISTNHGEIKLRFFPEATPKAYENFTKLSEKGYYNGTKFHRVIKDFMIQGGDPKGDGTGGKSIWGKPFEDEFSEGLRNYRGALCMANSGANSNGSQFFIVQNGSMPEEAVEFMKKNEFPEAVANEYVKLGGAPWLDKKHTVFGQIIEGMDVVDKIASVEVGKNDKPVEDVVIETIKIETVE